MSAATISINKKLNDGTLISVGGTSFDDLFANLVGVGGEELAVEIVAEVKAALTPTAAGAPVFVAQPAPQTVTQAANVVQGAFPQAQPATAPQGDTPPLCDHGMARVYKFGTSQSGKAWKAWMCPQPKGQSCEPQWVR